MSDEMQWPDDQRQRRLADGAERVRGRLYKLYERSTGFHGFVRSLTKLGRTLLVGGSPRDWVLSRANKDLDFVVDASKQDLLNIIPAAFTVTRFGGYRFKIDSVDIDVWTFATTVTLRSFAPGTVGIDDFLELVPFNIDAVGYDVDRHRLLENGFFRCMDERVLRRVFVDGHPDHAYCERRARDLLRKYALSPSPDVRYFLQERERVRSG